MVRSTPGSRATEKRSKQGQRPSVPLEAIDGLESLHGCSIVVERNQAGVHGGRDVPAVGHHDLHALVGAQGNRLRRIGGGHRDAFDFLHGEEEGQSITRPDEMP